MNGTVRYFSMFTGVGGFELGLERANDVRRNTEECSEDERNKSSTHSSNGTRRRSCTHSSKPFPKVEQDWEGWNRPINEWGELLRSGQVTSFPHIRSPESKVGEGSREHNHTKDKQFKWKCVGMSEIDKYASELLKQKFPSIKNWGDCTKIDPRRLPDFDMLCGGFPCQAFSIAGKRGGFEDTRGTMFFEIARILKIKRPKTLLLENVKGLLNHNKGETFRVILQTLDELGYEVEWMVLNSKFHGVPQNRERVFIIGNLRGTPKSEILPFGYTGEQANINIKRTQSDVSGKGYTSQQDRVYSPDGTMCCLPNANPDNKLNIAVLTPDRPEKRQNGRRFKTGGEPSFTLTGQDIHGVTDGIKIRRLTPTECERLQGFPDGWTEGFSDTQRYKMMGNAVTVNVIKVIGQRLIQ